MTQPVAPPLIPRHLTHEQLSDLLLATEPNAESVLDAKLEAHQQHLRDCLICASELELLRSSVSGFRSASTTIANRELARRPIQSPAALYAVRSSRFISPTFFWAATALVFAAALPLGFHQSLNPFLRPEAVPISVSAPSTTSASTLEADEALLEGINQDLSAAVPSSMQPLTGPSSSNTSSPQTASTQRTN
ncbi:hypothetical protein [Granulicella sp. dw_53]|uniref:hypothetical protein n=1 Tax=Granulicella sp. dw_53 TaxID=2719792 RepID=UPI001BD5C976|nr:hypothetical protein [Granulicella sp. dw_53]